MEMIIDFNKERLENTLSDFLNATGITINVTDESFNILTNRCSSHSKYCAYIQNLENGIERCMCSDKTLLERCRETKTAQYHECHAGLIDVGVPIIHADTIIGYLILGQMKKNTDFSKVLKEKVLSDADILKKYYDELVLYDESKIKSVINIALMLAKHILLEKMFYPVTNACIEKCFHYINRHLSEHFSIKKLSSSIGYSTSEIYKSFHKYHNCTVGEYITKCRIDYSTSLLLETDLSVEEISVKCGFSSSPYFSKKFKEHFGISPTTYRKQR